MNPQIPTDFHIFPIEASTVASSVDTLFLSMCALSLVFCIAIPAAMIYFSIKYRRRPGNDQPRRVGTSLALELAWTIIPCFIVLGMFIWGTRVFFLQTTQDPNALEILCTGKQWMWKFQHKNGRREIQDLHVPKGMPVRLKMSSEDVLHCVFVPAFRVKQDVMPGRYTYLNFEATRVGVYHLFCNQYCGTSHSQMIGKVFVMEPADYQKWLGGFTGDPPEKVGEQLFSSLACNTCHTGDTGSRGPLLNGLAGSKVLLNGGAVVTATDNYLRESILNSQAKVVNGYQPIMPTFEGVVSQEQVNALIAYLKTLPAGKDTKPSQTTAAVGASSGEVAPPDDQRATATAKEAALPPHATPEDRTSSTSSALAPVEGSPQSSAPMKKTSGTISKKLQNNNNDNSQTSVSETKDAATTAGELAAPPSHAGAKQTTTTGEQQGVQK